MHVPESGAPPTRPRRPVGKENRTAGPLWEGKKPRAKTLTQENAEGARRPEEKLRGAQRANPTPPSQERRWLGELGRSPGKHAGPSS